jgi:sugar transport system substrate-binding protein
MAATSRRAGAATCAKRWALASLAALAVAAAGTAHAETRLTIGVIELFPNPHFAHARKGIEDTAKKEGVDVIIQNANLDATKEAQDVQTFITRKVDAILLSAVSPTGSLAALRMAKAAGIPVVCYTTCVNPPDDKDLAGAFVKTTTRCLATPPGRRCRITSRRSSAARPKR